MGFWIGFAVVLLIVFGLVLHRVASPPRWRELAAQPRPGRRAGERNATGSTVTGNVQNHPGSFGGF